MEAPGKEINSMGRGKGSDLTGGDLTETIHCLLAQMYVAQALMDYRVRILLLLLFLWFWFFACEHITLSLMLYDVGIPYFYLQLASR